MNVGEQVSTIYLLSNMNVGAKYQGQGDARRKVQGST